MNNEEFYLKYPESKKVDSFSKEIRIVEEFIEWANYNKDCSFDIRDIYKWLNIDYEKYQKEVDLMYLEMLK
jgi:hypothetical protein